MESYDVAVIGGGPAGYAAALRAAALGARVALVEAEKPGGACVHHTCIPTNIMLGAAHTHMEARELDVMGVFQAGEKFNLARSAARKDALVRKMADGIAAALRMRKVVLIGGRASFLGAHTLAVTGAGEAWADAIIVATGSRWEVPSIPGVHADRVLTVDQVQALPEPPASALVLADGPADTAFGVEYATLLALGDTEVTVATARERLLPGLDPLIEAIAVQSLTDLGVAVHTGATVEGRDWQLATVRSAAGEAVVAAEVIVAADPRVPALASLNLAAAGVQSGTTIAVDGSCRTNVAHIFAAGDVTGGAMLTNAASHMGEVAGANAAGGDERTALKYVPHLLHTVPEVAWIGLTEERARAQGRDIATGTFDLGYNARAITLGAREGLVKVVVDRATGELAGVHAAGPDAAELLAVAATVMQAEIPAENLASLVAWHPSIAEGLVEAVRRTL
ncbi:MAG: NAD(P)/FAD-dependent oxidoreductase [Dehalococcoidia bacterium]|nr:NAD(P)/FAD-dependent oxidoreductase [Dehalococcoidia bacterium]